MSSVATPQHELESLADVLWVERHVVELLLYRLVAAKMFLAADERRYVSLALDEVEHALGRLRQAEERRVETVQSVAGVIGVRGSDLTLNLLAKSAPEPLRSVFADHLDAFGVLANEIEQTAKLNRQLASSALGSVRESLNVLTGAAPAPIYTAAGRVDASVPTPVALDRVL